MNNIITEYFSILLSQFKFDVEVFSHPWMYYYILVPALGYLCFFMIKWSVLTAPIWIPIYNALRLSANFSIRKSR